MNSSWVFDGVPPSGKIEGGNLASYVFQPSLDTLVRESLQNANDQALDAGPVSVEFEFIEMRGEVKTRLLEAIGWESLRPHLDSVADDDNLVAGRLKSILKSYEQEPLRVLVIRDSSTKGLYGGEDAKDGNFGPLCKHVLVTPDGKTLGGGSHGLGKAVLWTFSGISTVSFASVPNDNDDPGTLRYISRTEQPHHTIKTADGETPWTGSGWHGTVSRVPGGDRASSIRGPEARSLLKATPLLREDGDWGTSILIPFFFEPEEEDTRSLLEIAGDTVVSVNRWFWPSLITNRLRVTVSVREGTSTLMSEMADGGQIAAPFIEAWNDSVTGEKALTAGEIAETLIPFSPPPRKPEYKPAGKFEGELCLRVRRASEAETSHDQIDTIALVRGAHMVVKYYSPSVPLEARGFFGVLKAGRANGDSPSDEAVEMFLRAAEPPEHNRWEDSTNNLRSRYQKGSRARLTELWGELSARVRSICKSDVPHEGEGPDKLKRLFPLGGESTPKVPGYRVNFNGMDRVDGSVVISAVVKRKLNGQLPKPWAIQGHFVLKGESGKGESLELVEVTPIDRNGLNVVVLPKEFTIAVEKEIDQVVVTVSAKDPATSSFIAARSIVEAIVVAREAK
jgi:hypothetical protein